MQWSSLENTKGQFIPAELKQKSFDLGLEG